MPEWDTNEQDLNEILRIRRNKLKDLRNRGKDPFKAVSFDTSSNAVEIKDNFEKMEGTRVSLAGRIMSKREMGKASFADIQDGHGRIQLFFKVDEVGQESYEEFKKLDIGDIIGVKGSVFKTHKGEISVRVESYELLSKSLQPLPEKWHGLKDVDLRYRQRYVDLIVNPGVKDTFIKRSKIIGSMRRFLDSRGFIEVETPILNVIPGGGAAKPFVTYHNALDMELYLRIAPELYLKRLLVGGFEKVYEIGRLFRNEGISVKHNPEFTSMEVYQAYTDYKGMMELTEQMISHIVTDVCGSLEVEYQGMRVDFSLPWKRITMADAVKEYCGVDFNTIEDDLQATRILKEKGIDTGKTVKKGEVLNMLFEEYVEEHLVQPTFVYDYPVEVSPLAKRKPDMPGMTERFELFITGREIGNAFTELNDPEDQKERFLDQVRKREEGNEEANMMDEDFLLSLEYGMPPAGGLGIGIDRLVMILTDSPSIRDVLLFPTMKPRD
jgi:lysyl-tRNA synthetase class 2